MQYLSVVVSTSICINKHMSEPSRNNSKGYSHRIYLRAVSYSLAFLHRFHPHWSGQCTVHVAIPKCQINQFKSVQQSRQKAVRVYCPKVYTVLQCKSENWQVSATPHFSQSVINFFFSSYFFPFFYRPSNFA